MERKRKTGKQLVSILLTAALMVPSLPISSVYAGTEESGHTDITEGTAEPGTETEQEQTIEEPVTEQDIDTEETQPEKEEEEEEETDAAANEEPDAIIKEQVQADEQLVETDAPEEDTNGQEPVQDPEKEEKDQENGQDEKEETTWNITWTAAQGAQDEFAAMESEIKEAEDSVHIYLPDETDDTKPGTEAAASYENGKSSVTSSDLEDGDTLFYRFETEDFTAEGAVTLKENGTDAAIKPVRKNASFAFIAAEDNAYQDATPVFTDDEGKTLTPKSSAEHTYTFEQMAGKKLNYSFSKDGAILSGSVVLSGKDTVTVALDAEASWEWEGTAPSDDEAAQVYTNTDVTMTLTVIDPDFNEKGSSVAVNAKDEKGNTVKIQEGNWTEDGDTHKYSLTFTKEAVYTIHAEYTLASGGKIDLGTRYFTLDKTVPIGKITVSDGNQTKKYEQSSADVAFRYFSKSDITIVREASDSLSGLKSVSYYLDRDALEKNGVFKALTADELGKLTWTSWDDAFTISSKDENGNDTEDGAILYCRLEDRAGNVSYINSEDGVIADSVKPKEPVITFKEEKTVYDKDVAVHIAASEDDGKARSGLKSVEYVITSNGKVTQKGNFNDKLKDRTQRTKTIEGDIVVSAKQNNSDRVTVTVTAEDAAGNIVSKTTSPFAIDITKPEISVEYDNNDVRNGQYFKDDRQAKVVFKERSFQESKTEFTFTVDGKNYTASITDIEAGEIPGVYLKDGAEDSEKGRDVFDDDRTVSYTIGFGGNGKKADHDYTFDITTEDAAGNKSEGITFAKGTAAASDFTVDEVAPVMTASYQGAAPTGTKEAPGYTKENVSASYTIKERCFDENGFKAEITGTDVDGNDLQAYAGTEEGKWEGSGNERTRVLPDFTTEANYAVKASYTDLAGNEAVLPEVYFTIDRTAPNGTVTVTNDSESGTFSSFIRKLFFWFFSSHTITASETADDRISGLASNGYYLYEPGPEARGIFDGLTEGQLEQVTWTPWQDTVKIEPDKGVIVYSRMEDKAGNVSYIASEEGAIADQQAPSAPVITVPDAEYGRGVYNGNVPVSIHVEDIEKGNTYSGLKSVTYRVLSNGKETQSGNFNEGLEDRRERKRTIDGSFTVEAAKNNSNDVTIEVTAQDWAGNTSRSEKKLKIDITKPVITVEYDNNDVHNGKYYNKKRTATVTVEERNFSKELADVKVTGTDGSYTVSGWKSEDNGSDASRNVLTIDYEKDSDFTFTINVTDLAGNKTEYGKTDAFTVDLTKPTVRILYDTSDARNGRYYNKVRTATVEVTEHNFSPETERLAIEAALEGHGIAKPSLGAWQAKGDVHTAPLVFEKDGDYSFTFDIKDLADNESETARSDSFTIDRTAPDIKIAGIEDRHAYNGKTAPLITMEDLHFDQKTGSAEVTGKKGKKLNVTVTEKAQGKQAAVEDPEEKSENDDIYTLTAKASDLAGNETVKTITYSINRFGSNFYLGDDAQAATKTYYNKKIDTITVYEVNVNEVVSAELSKGFQDGTEVLTEGKDYKRTEETTEDGWKKYTYQVKGSVFKEDGHYDFFIRTTDAAGNEQNNTIKDLPVSFVVDTTPPTVTIAGAEDGKSYEQESLDMNILPADNIKFEKAAVYLDGKKAVSFTEKDLKDGSYLFRIKQADHDQTVTVKACDAAGNETEKKLTVFVNSSHKEIMKWNAGRTIPFLLLSLGVVTAVVLLVVLYQRKKDRDGQDRE